MIWIKILRPLFFVGIALGTVIFIFYYFTTLSSARPTKANLIIDTKKVIGKLPTNWRAFAQGGEELGTPMLHSVLSQISELTPSYIRIDHIYDGYSVVGRGSDGRLQFNWSRLDQTVCDIYVTGARPFFSLSYMPSAISTDGSPISQPSNWNEWALVVQKTIERYSGRDTVLCNGTISGSKLIDTYYEVWNEPDLEAFGKWSVYGEKSYLTLYYYSAIGASQAQSINRFKIGGPATTGPYKNWFQGFIAYVSSHNLPVDFLSWHHYTKNPDDYLTDVLNLNDWLSDPQYTQYKGLPRIISEWGYDSAYNPIADTNVGAAHIIMSLRNLIDQNVALAFAFELKDGPSPSWGILTNQGAKKPRYFALQFLNQMRYFRLKVDGEGTYVRAIASAAPGIINIVLVNYDPSNENTELVPVLFNNLDNGNYTLTIHYLEGQNVSVPNITPVAGKFRRDILMNANMVIALELTKQ